MIKQAVWALTPCDVTTVKVTHCLVQKAESVLREPVNRGLNMYFQEMGMQNTHLAHKFTPHGLQVVSVCVLVVQ